MAGKRKKGPRSKKKSKILINAQAPEECRVALIENGKLEAFELESVGYEATKGNIYKGRIVNVETGLQAVFVDIGLNRNGYLPFEEIHPDYYGYAEDKTKISGLLKKGQDILVQVVKEETPLKGAYVTTYLSLPGRFLVLMPGNPHVGVSRKIEEEKERIRLKNILKQTKLPEGVGIIARTAAAKATKAEILKDLRYLSRLWKSLKKAAKSAPSPALLYRDRELTTRFLRDYLTTDVSEIIVDHKETYERIRSFLKIIAPRQVSTLTLYEKERPLFEKYGIENQIEQIFQPRVNLPSGGYIIIEPTEAMVSIDVNSGKNIKEKDLEDTALATNLEAAEEIARQLRLRDLGGIIVIDFIDMRSKANRSLVEKRLRQSLKKDKAKTEVARISRFGLLQLVRQKLKSPVKTLSYVKCPYCKGAGLIKSVESLSLLYLRLIGSKLASRQASKDLKDECQRLVLEVPPAVASYLLNKKRAELSRLEQTYKIFIQIEPKERLGAEEYYLYLAKEQ